MSILKEAETTQAKFKGGVFGGAGSGKTWTAALIALGLKKLTKDPRPIAFYDSETGSDFIKKKLFDPAGVKMLQVKSRSFSDLTETIREAEERACVLITDSISHVWEEYTEAYLKAKKQSFIELWDWKELKKEWRHGFTDQFINSNLHFIICGREAAVYEMQQVEKGGRTKMEAQKVGTKMKSEAETGYEPSLLLQMEKVFLPTLTGAKSAKYVRRCHVIKDRFDAIDSKDFDNPTFEDFLPHVSLLDLAGKQFGIDTSRKTEGVFSENGGEVEKRVKRRAILCEELNGLLMHYIPGAGTKEKDARQELVFKHFGTRSWKALEEDWKAVPLEKLTDLMAPRDGAPSIIEADCIKTAEQFSGAK